MRYTCRFLSHAVHVASFRFKSEMRAALFSPAFLQLSFLQPGGCRRGGVVAWMAILPWGLTIQDSSPVRGGKCGPSHFEGALNIVRAAFFKMVWRPELDWFHVHRMVWG
jgi:hypothetical protein